MTQRPKDIGTAAETAVVRVLQRSGFPYAERRALRGTYDCGDVTGTVGICWEIKGGKAAKDITDGKVAAWLSETERERVNAKADVGVLVVQRKGVGYPNADRWWAYVATYLTPDALTLTMRPHAPFTGPVPPGALAFPARFRLSHLIAVLHAAGYGDADLGGQVDVPDDGRDVDPWDPYGLPSIIRHVDLIAEKP